MKSYIDISIHIYVRKIDKNITKVEVGAHLMSLKINFIYNYANLAIKVKKEINFDKKVG